MPIARALIFFIAHFARHYSTSASIQLCHTSESPRLRLLLRCAQGICEHDILLRMDDLLNALADALASPLFEDEYVAQLLTMTHEISEPASRALSGRVTQRRKPGTEPPTEKCAALLFLARG